MSSMQFSFYLTVDHVHDGDTIYGELDQGLNRYSRPIGVRLDGVDADELGTPEGDAALVAINALISPGDLLQVVSVKWDKYANRIDAGPVINTRTGQDIIKVGLDAGWLRPWDGHGPKPW